MRENIIIVVLGLIIYIGYQFSPIPECGHIAEVLKDTSKQSILGFQWGFWDQVSCVFSSAEQREKWTTSAEVYRFNAFRLNQTMPGLKRN